jgi:predicted DNA-binding transcriptional regulator AlpA
MDGSFPNQELLDRKQVLSLLDMSLSTFRRWLKTSIGKRFPTPLILADEPGEKPMLRYRKREVLAFIDLLEREKRDEEGEKDAKKHRSKPDQS